MTTTELTHETRTMQTGRHLVAGRHRLHARIGHGRLGEIYEAVDEGYQELGAGQRVAIQLLPDRIALDKGLFSKLQLGYTALRAVSHPNIVTFLDFDHDGKFGYLVMDLLDGASLRFVLDDVTTLPLDETIPVTRAVGDALQFLHAKSIVHGQLTAENVFVTENLEVRLLDVVPLDTASTILRGVASGDPFSRCDVGDDVYALACLTYEMLAGKHPFNFQTPAEARVARLEPARINSLPERQWNAICRGLSFDRKQRPVAIADFFREFGITGTERLRLSEDETTARASPPRVTGNDAPPAAHSADPSRSAPAPDHFATAKLTGPAVWHKENVNTSSAKRKSAKRMPSPILLMALVGLVIWFFYGQPRDDVAKLIAYVDSYLDVEFAGSGDGSLPFNASDLTLAASRDAGPAIPLPGTPTQTAAEDDAGAETTGVSMLAGHAAGNEAASTQPSYPTASIASRDAGAAAGATDEEATQPGGEQFADPGADASRSNDDAAADALASTADVAGPSRSESEFTLIQSFVTISERDGAARITARRPRNTEGRVFWWTSDGTAIANEDYIPIDQPVVGFASGEEFETLHIPLINDSLPEPRETFYVYLGQYYAQLGRLEPILHVRVDIDDDE